MEGRIATGHVSQQHARQPWITTDSTTLQASARICTHLLELAEAGHPPSTLASCVQRRHCQLALAQAPVSTRASASRASPDPRAISRATKVRTRYYCRGSTSADNTASSTTLLPNWGSTTRSGELRTFPASPGPTSTNTGTVDCPHWSHGEESWGTRGQSRRHTRLSAP